MSKEKLYGGVWTKRELIDNLACRNYRENHPGQSCTPHKLDDCYCWQAGIIQGTILNEQDQIRLREAQEYIQSLPSNVRDELLKLYV